MPEQEYRQEYKLSDVAAIRWFANTIENEMLQTYFGDTSTYMTIKDILRRAIEELHRIPVPRASACPYPPCPDGECKPDCLLALEEKRPRRE